MAGNSSTVKVNITGSSKKLNKALGAADTKLQSFSKKLDGIGTKLTSMGKGLTMGLTVPLVAGAGLAISWASDMEESVTKVDNIFGAHSDKIHALTDDAATMYGLSTGEAEAAYGTIGNVLKTLGVDAEVLPDVSSQVLTLGTDLASFHNLETDDVLNRINAALVGEYDSLKKIAPGVNATAVANRAMADTGKTVASELTNEEKAMATLALVTEAGTDAKGDFAETSDGLANSVKIMKGEIKTAAEEIGENFTPLVSKAAQWVTDLVDGFVELSPELQRVVIGVGAVAAAAGPMLMVVGSIARGVSALTGLAALGPVFTVIGAAAQFMWTSILAPILPFIAIAAAVIAVFALLYFHVQPIRDAIDSLVDIIWNGLVAAFNWVVDTLWPKIQSWISEMGALILDLAQRAWPIIVAAVQRAGELFQEVFSTIWDVVSKVFNWITETGIPAVVTAFQWVSDIVQDVVSAVVAGWEWVWDKISAFIDWFNNNVTPVIESVIGLVMAIFNRIKPVLSNVFNWIKAALGILFNVFSNIFNWIGNVIGVFINFLKATLLPVVTTIFNGIVAVLTPVFNVIKTIFTTAMGVISAIWTVVWNVIKAVVPPIFNNIKSFIENVLHAIKVIIDTVTSIINADWTNIWNTIKQFVLDLWNGIKDKIGTAVTKVKDLIAKGLQTIKTKWNDVWNGIKTKLNDVWTGIKDKVSSTIQSIVDLVKGLPDKLTDVIGKLATAAKSLGSTIIDGIKDGLESAVGLAGDIASGVWRAVKGAINTNVIDKLNSVIPNSIGIGPFKVDIKDNPIPNLAMGTGNFTGGVAMVGERGPETVFLPRGSSVIPNHNRGSGGTEVTINANTNVSADTIASELNWLLNYSGR